MNYVHDPQMRPVDQPEQFLSAGPSWPGLNLSRWSQGQSEHPLPQQNPQQCGRHSVSGAESLSSRHTGPHGPETAPFDHGAAGHGSVSRADASELVLLKVQVNRYINMLAGIKADINTLRVELNTIRAYVGLDGRQHASTTFNSGSSFAGYRPTSS